MLRSPVRLSSPLMRYGAMALDATIIFSCGFASYYWYHGTAVHEHLHTQYLMVMLTALLMLVLFSDRIYRSWRVNELRTMLRSVAECWLASMLVIVLGLFLAKASSELSRAWFITWFVAMLVALCMQRLLLYSGLRWLRSQGYNYKSVLIVGYGPTSEHVNQLISESAWCGLRVVATLPPEQLAPYLANSRERQPDEVWLCVPFSDREGIVNALESLRHSTANIRMVPDWFSLRLLNHGISEVIGIPMLDLSSSPVKGMTRFLKALEDRVLAAFILILISPVMIAIAAAVKWTSPGPVLFKQLRHGWNGEEIRVYKFRSMMVHTEHGGQVTQATKNDARLTPLGAFLRRTSLDELPQFFNVLQGRMSIVGPRPHALAHNEHYKERVAGYMLRHKVKPGITGWAQINGFRGETDTLDKMERRVECDLYYIEHLSVWLDLKIIAATVFKGFWHKNAY